jgi:hypothetical protein
MGNTLVEQWWLALADYNTTENLSTDRGHQRGGEACLRSHVANLPLEMEHIHSTLHGGIGKGQLTVVIEIRKLVGELRLARLS